MGATMKFKRFNLCSVSILFSGLLGTACLAQADYSQIPMLSDLRMAVVGQFLPFKEQGRITGFFSTDSCLYSNDKIVILEDYCFPKKKYPAKSFTVFSQDLGMLQFYQELVGNYTQHVVRVLLFPEDLKQLLHKPIAEMTIADLNNIYAAKKKNLKPFCWATNHDLNTGNEIANCYLVDIKNYKDWSVETLHLVNDDSQWLDTMNLLTLALIK